MVDAISSLSIAIDLDKKFVKALLERAELYKEVQQFQDSVKDLETVCKITTSPHKKLLQEAKSELKVQKIPPMNFCSLSEKEQNKILAKSKKEKGNKFFRSQNYEKANELYSEAITLDPDCPVLYSNRSACQLMLKKYDESLLDAVKSLELDGTFVKGYLRKGKVELILGNGEGSLQTFKEGLKIDPNDKNLKEQKDKAIKLIRAISKGNDASERKDFVKASDWFTEAVNIASYCSALLTKKLESLLYCYHRFYDVHWSLDQHEKDSNFYYIIALSDYLKSNMFQSVSNLNKSLEIDDTHLKSKILKQKIEEFKYYILEGISAYHICDHARARSLFQKVAEIDPYNKCMCEFAVICQAVNS